MFISQSDTMQINMARQSQDEQNGQRIVFMERIKNMAIPYIKYFDVDADGIRCASKTWEILQ
tara:strand:+ start:72 stop:257 length:186 start_codon:yes stop_codon:yes gene_type:complete